MFPFSKSKQAAARVQAENLLRLADKVDCYRRDVVPAEALAKLRAASAKLQKLWEEKKSPAEELEQACLELHEAMVPCGGDIYPLTFLGEYSEMLIGAAILVIGIRTFFLQPFKIPTNSMYPTYYGMTPYVYKLDEPPPNPVARVFNFITQGAVHYDVPAPADGEVTMPVSESLAAEFKTTQQRVWSRLWLVSEDQREYSLRVGEAAVTVRVPYDFDRGFEEAFFATYFPDLYQAAWKDPQKFYGLLQKSGHLRPNGFGRFLVTTGRQVKAGDRILDFDLRTGDMLFVDRISYNFIAPKPGDPFVFHTGGIDDLWTQLPDGRAVHEDQYYIKRLVGAPGDVLEVKPPVLYRNGQPNVGAAAFDKNARQEGNYPGYSYGNIPQTMHLHPGETYTVPAGHYFPMGDNSPTSYDGRYWGAVPAQNVVGRAVFIVYPFTFRWGISQ
jgi:signal peptidase I